MPDNISFHTSKEIEAQPALWMKVTDYFKDRKKDISHFLSPLLKKHNLKIVLTGAGSSAFIGKVVQHSFKHNLNISTKAVSTTSLVTHFDNYIDLEDPLLLISFARSGNSPESNAVIDLAEQHCSDVHHIAITCNKNGGLAEKMDSLENGLKIVLPTEAEDRGLAMTGSFTGMMLTSLLIARINSFESLSNIATDISLTAENLINTYTDDFKRVASFDFDRIVFLGSGPLLNVARESHLKVQELTDGIVIGKHDSFLGLRHGPKAVIHDNTVVVHLFSPDPHVFKYEKDLAEEISNDRVDAFTIGLFSNKKQSESVDCNLKILFDPAVANGKADDLHFIPYVLPAQFIGLYKSLELGLDPDSPSRNGAISRVVRGVTIYPEG